MGLGFNPQRMCEGYGSRSVCVCVCVFCTSCYIPGLYIESKVLLGFLWHFQDMHCVDFIKTLCSKVLLTFADLLRFLTSSRLMKRDGEHFISRLVVYSSSDSSYNSTDSSLVIVGYRLRFLALLCTRFTDLACMWYCYIIAFNQY